MSHITVDVTATAPGSMNAVLPIASAQFYPRGIALDTTHVYWATVEGGIHRSKRDGSGSDETLASASDNPDLNPYSITIDATYVYWTTWGHMLRRVRLRRGKSAWPRAARGKNRRDQTDPCGGVFLPSGIAVDSSAVYWTNWFFPSVMRVAL